MTIRKETMKTPDSSNDRIKWYQDKPREDDIFTDHQLFILKSIFDNRKFHHKSDIHDLDYLKRNGYYFEYNGVYCIDHRALNALVKKGIIN